jgi:hypothetical protein
MTIFTTLAVYLTKSFTANKIYQHRARSGFEPEPPAHIRTWTWNASNSIMCSVVGKWGITFHSAFRRLSVFITGRLQSARNATDGDIHSSVWSSDIPVLKQRERGCGLLQNGWIPNRVVPWSLDYMKGGWSGLLGNPNHWGETRWRDNKKIIKFWNKIP